MLFEIYHRICVGLPLEPAATEALVQGFHRSLGVAPEAAVSEIHALLRFDARRHEKHITDRIRYERAFEAYVDQLWDVDCAIGGVSAGGLDPDRGYLLVGVRVEDFDYSVRDDQPAATQRPRALRKGDLSMGSDFAHELGPDAHKAFSHAAKMYQRAGKEIVRDATGRTAKLPLARGDEPAWCYVRWLVRA